MATQLDPGKVENLQVMETVVSGPDGANRLFTVMGTVPVEVSLSNQSQARQEPPRQQAFTLLLGPTLTRREFHRAIASAFAAGFGVTSIGALQGDFSWSIADTDADWDDESRQVRLRFEVHLQARLNSGVSVTRVGFQVVILAEVAQS